jgi:hypothetical protein
LDRLENKVDEKIDAVLVKVDHLIKFKWQIIGGSAVVSFIVSVALLVIFGSGH